MVVGCRPAAERKATAEDTQAEGKAEGKRIQLMLIHNVDWRSLSITEIRDTLLANQLLHAVNSLFYLCAAAMQAHTGDE